MTNPNRAATAASHINTGLLWISGGAIVVLLLTILGSVFFRYVLNDPLPWTNDVARLALSVCVFAALPPGLEHGAHIAVDLQLNGLPAWANRARDGVRRLAIPLVITSWLVLSFSRARDAFSDGRDLPGMVLEVPAYLLYGLQCLLLAQFALTALLLAPTTTPPKKPDHAAQ